MVMPVHKRPDDLFHSQNQHVLFEATIVNILPGYYYCNTNILTVKHLLEETNPEARRPDDGVQRVEFKSCNCTASLH